MGTMTYVGLLSCSTKKLDRSAPARDLYSASTLFRLSLAYLETFCDQVYVMSALHYLVELDRVIEPYDRRLPTRKRELDQWGHITGCRIVGRHGRFARYMMLAGADYVIPVRREMTTYLGHRPVAKGSDTYAWQGVPHANIATPLDGMQIGERMSWLSHRRDEPKTASQKRDEFFAGAFDAA